MPTPPKRLYVGPCGQVVAWKKIPDRFSALEINSTFYRFPTDRQLANWAKALSEGREERPFRLIIKAFQGLTHPTRSPTWKRAGLSREELAALTDQVGCLRLNETTRKFLERTLALCQTLRADYLLFQFPAFCRERAKALPAFFEAMPGVFSAFPAIEIRWEAPEFLESLWEKYRVVPVFDPFLEPGLFERFAANLPVLYFRLHGRRDERGRLLYRYKYSEEELKALRAMILEAAAEEILVLFNNTYMKEDASRFLQLL